MSGTSSVGGRGVYEAGDQRNSKDSETNVADRYHEGQPNSHKANDSSMFASPEKIESMKPNGGLQRMRDRLPTS